jgi:hypothetical protein
MIFVIAITVTEGSMAQTRNYTVGSAWQVSLIKTETGQDVAYLNSLKSTWKSVMEEAKTQGLILSYKMLAGNAANPEDWNVLLMIEYKNLAAMEGNEDKWEAIQARVVGNEDAQNKLRDSRVKMRTIFGGKLVREIVYK